MLTYDEARTIQYTAEAAGDKDRARIARYRADAADYRDRAKINAQWSLRDADHYATIAAERDRLANELEKELDTSN